MKNLELLDELDQRDLIPAEISEMLRTKIAQQGDQVTVESILGFLVKQEYLSQIAANKFLLATQQISPQSEVGNLGLAPLDETGSEDEDAPNLADEEIVTLTPLDSRQNMRLEQLDEESSASSNIFDEGPGPRGASVSRLSSLSALSSKAKMEAETEALLAEVSGAHAIPQKPIASKRKLKKKKNEWESSLILYGGGGLLVLICTGALIYWLLNRENADVVLKDAGDFFNGGSYTQAIHQYEHFVQNYPRHPQYSAAKVKLELARLWKDTTNSDDFENALETARSVVETIENEPEFRSAQRDLASLFPKIAQGLANQAEAAETSQLAETRVEQARTALALCRNTKYLPKEFRDEVLLDEIDETLSKVARVQLQKLDLSKALTEIDSLLAKSDISQAYQVRSDLLEKHPALIHDETLSNKVQEISQAEAKIVQYVAEVKPALPGPRDSAVVAELTLAERLTKDSLPVEGTVAFRVGGSIFGLSAGSGALVWREYLGSDPQSYPLSLGGGDFLVNDLVHGEVVRLAGATGKALWRLPIGPQMLQPVIAESRAFVAERSGKLFVIDLDSGEQNGYFQFGQPLAAAPAVDRAGKRLYLAAEHSSLYAVSTEKSSCLGVYYLGHSAGSIVVPPVKVLEKLIVAANTGLTSSELSVLNLDAQGVVSGRDTSVRLTGTIDTPLLTEARRLVAVSSRGQISAFEVVSEAGDSALSKIAARDAHQTSSVAHFGLLTDGNAWLAANRINELAIIAAGNRIQLKNLEDDFAGDVFDHPLQRLGNLILHVRRPQRQAGAVIAATDIATGKTVWQTQVAVPLAGQPAVDPEQNRITAITSTGAGYQFDRETLVRRIQDGASIPIGNRSTLPTFSASVDLGGGGLAVAEIGSESILFYRPGDSDSRPQRIALPGPLAANLIAWGEGFVAATSVGQIFLFDRKTGEQVGSPYQPPLEADQNYLWLTPAVVPAADNSPLVVSDGKQSIRLVKLKSTPLPHLESFAEKPLGEIHLETALAAGAETILAGTDTGTMARFGVTDLAPREPIPLGGRVTWGPFALGEFFLLTTDAGELVGLNSGGEILWRQPLGEKVPCGKPLEDGEAAIVAWQRHGISRVALADGKELGQTPVEQGLVQGPVLFAGRLILTVADGSLLVVNRP